MICIKAPICAIGALIQRGGGASSIAAQCGLQPGLVLASVNGTPAGNLSFRNQIGASACLPTAFVPPKLGRFGDRVLRTFENSSGLIRAVSRPTELRFHPGVAPTCIPEGSPRSGSDSRVIHSHHLPTDLVAVFVSGKYAHCFGVPGG